MEVTEVNLQFRLKKMGEVLKIDPTSCSVLGHLGFEMGDYLGGGEFSRVRQAKWTKSQDRIEDNVAIKIIPKFKAPEEYYVKHLPNEIYAVKKTQAHPLIVNLYHVYEGPKAYYLIFEYLPMGDLLDYVNKRKFLGEAESRKFFKQLLDAVDYCHSQGIAHRDIKLDNILLDRKFNIRLCDFGFAAFITADGYCSTDCGSVLYAAPEVYHSPNCYDGTKADIWSMGVCLYGMLCGKLPFNIPDPTVVQRAVSTNVKFSRLLSKNCRHLIRRLLDTRPQFRLRVPEIKQSPWLSQPIDIFTPEECPFQSSYTSLLNQENGQVHLDPSTEHGFACDPRMARKQEVRAKFVSGVLRAVATLKSEGKSAEDLLRKDPQVTIGVRGSIGKEISQEIIKMGNNRTLTTMEEYGTGMVAMPAQKIHSYLQTLHTSEMNEELGLLKFSVAGRMALKARERATAPDANETNFGRNLRFKAAVLRVQRERMDRWRLVCHQMLASSATFKQRLAEQLEKEGSEIEPSKATETILQVLSALTHKP